MAERPTAIFAANDYMALGTYQAIIEEGQRVPEDIALIGFNDIEFTATKGVELTTIGQKKYEMGALAVKILVEKIDGGESKTFNERDFFEARIDHPEDLWVLFKRLSN